MESMLHGWWVSAQPILISVGLKILGSIVAFILGRWLIHVVTNLLGTVLTKQEVDATVQRYLVNIVSVALNIVLVIVLLGYFGVETTSFAALLAGAGIAIGSAWGGLLSNFASGVFLIILRPFKVGDYVVLGGVEGTVVEIGLFGTGINTPDNVRTIIGNGKILSNDIKNFAINPHRRIDLLVQLDASDDVLKAIQVLKEAVQKVPNVLEAPAIEVDLLSFTELGPVVAVRPSVASKNYGQAYFDCNRAVYESLGKAGYAGPKRHVLVHSKTL